MFFSQTHFLTLAGGPCPSSRGGGGLVAGATGPTRGGTEYDDKSATGLASHLARHDIHADALHLASDHSEASDLILSRAKDLGCDLIVMGGYGHSRTRELILGGVTRGVLQHMTVPVLMSH